VVFTPTRVEIKGMKDDFDRQIVALEQRKGPNFRGVWNQCTQF